MRARMVVVHEMRQMKLMNEEMIADTDKASVGASPLYFIYRTYIHLIASLLWCT